MFSRRLVAGAAVLAVSGAGLLIPAVVNAATSPGTITFNPATGTDSIIVGGVTSGPCDVKDANGPANSYDVLVTGPGAFAPNPGAGRGHGVSFRAQTPNGFSNTQPITFSSRINFHDFAEELGQPLLPGHYVITLRCDNDFGQTGQTYQGSITFTGGPPATAYTATNAPPASSSPSPTSKESPTSTPTTTSGSATTTPATSTSDAAGATTSSDPGGGTHPLASTDTLAKTRAPIALILLGGLILLAAGLAWVVWRKRPRKAALSDGGDIAGERETGRPDRE